MRDYYDLRALSSTEVDGIPLPEVSAGAKIERFIRRHLTCVARISARVIVRKLGARAL